MFETLLQSSYFALFLIIALGFMLGRIQIKGLSLDVSAVIFIALLFGHFGVIIPKELGLSLIHIFTAILFMSCCLFLTVGCQQKKQGFDDKSVSQAIQKVIQIKYPGATITDYDKDAAGVEVDIKDKGVKKEVLLGKNNEWLSTKFDIHAEDVPVDIMDNLTNSAYHEYKIDEVTQIDKPSGTFYVFKLEHENNEVRLTFNSEAQLLK